MVTDYYCNIDYMWLYTIIEYVYVWLYIIVYNVVHYTPVVTGVDAGFHSNPIQKSHMSVLKAKII